MFLVLCLTLVCICIAINHNGHGSGNENYDVSFAPPFPLNEDIVYSKAVLIKEDGKMHPISPKNKEMFELKEVCTLLDSNDFHAVQLCGSSLLVISSLTHKPGDERNKTAMTIVSKLVNAIHGEVVTMELFGKVLICQIAQIRPPDEYEQ